jgi:hypothetical protein
LPISPGRKPPAEAQQFPAVEGSHPPLCGKKIKMDTNPIIIIIPPVFF